jgi:hypothetical protein
MNHGIVAVCVVVIVQCDFAFLSDLEAMDEKQIETMSIQDAERLTIFS